jgi:glycosyltransferase involved in cell wall biosynthesis
MRLSIVTPSYNQAQYIERTIESVLGQNYPDLEYWVIDGGSTDGTLDLLRRYEGRLHWISEKDNGQSDAINKGWARCTGDVVAWTNSDDTYAPGSFEKVMKVFGERPDVDFVCGDIHYIDEEDRILKWDSGGPFDVRRHIRMGYCLVHNQSAFYRRSLLRKVGGGVDTSLHYAMDFDLFCRMGLAGKSHYIPEVLGNFRYQPQSKTSTGPRKMTRESRMVRSRYLNGWSDRPWTWYYDFRVELYLLLEPYLLRRKAGQPAGG